MTPQEEKEIANAFNQVFNRAQLDAIKATFTDSQKEIYNQTMIAQKATLLEQIKGLPKTKLDEMSRLFDGALL